MSVVAKFKCSQVANGQVALQAVEADSEENRAFFEATPSGSISMGIVNPSALEAFEEGASYRVTFERVS